MTATEKAACGPRAVVDEANEIPDPIRLEDVYLSIHADMEKVQAGIIREARSVQGSRSFRKNTAEYMTGAVTHIFKHRGKMLRPALAILSSRLSGSGTAAVDEDIIALSTAVEIFHMASLAHDDVVDHELFRREQVTLNNKYGEHLAVLVGDILYAKFFSLLTRLTIKRADADLSLFSLFCELTERMCVAEIGEQYLKETPGGSEADDYLMTLQYKTADFMAACCEASGILSGASEERRAALATFGRSFGMAFQLMDDLYDGDAIMGEPMDLRAKACMFAGQAEEALRSFPENQARKDLHRLCRFILQ